MATFSCKSADILRTDQVTQCENRKARQPAKCTPLAFWSAIINNMIILLFYMNFPKYHDVVKSVWLSPCDGTFLLGSKMIFIDFLSVIIIFGTRWLSDKAYSLNPQYLIGRSCPAVDTQRVDNDDDDSFLYFRYDEIEQILNVSKRFPQN